MRQFPKNTSFISRKSLSKKDDNHVDSIKILSKSREVKAPSKEISINIYNNVRQEIKKEEVPIQKKKKETPKPKKAPVRLEKQSPPEKKEKKQQSPLPSHEAIPPESRRSKTFKDVPVILNKSSLSFVSEKDNNYYRRLKQEKFPRHIQKMLAQGFDDSFITYIDPRNPSQVKKSCLSILPQNNSQPLSKSKLNQWVEQKSILNDLESQVSRNKYSQIYKKNSQHNKNIYSFTHIDARALESLEPKGFLFSKKKGDREPQKSRRSHPNKSVPTFSHFSGAQSRIFENNSKLLKANINGSICSQRKSKRGHAEERLKQILTLQTRIGSSNSIVLLNSCHLSQACSSQKEAGATESRKSESKQQPTLKSMKGYLNLESKSVSAKSSQPAPSLPSDLEFGGESLSKEVPVSSLEITLEVSGKSFSKALKLDQLKSVNKLTPCLSQLSPLSSSGKLNPFENTETKPHTNDSKAPTHLDTTEPSITNLKTNYKSSENSYLQMKSTFEMDMQNLLRSKEMPLNKVFVKSQKISEIEIGAEKGVEESIADVCASSPYKESISEIEKMGKEVKGENLEDIEKHTKMMIECLEEKENECSLIQTNSSASIEAINKKILDQMIDQMLKDDIWSKAIKSKTLQERYSSYYSTVSGLEK